MQEHISIRNLRYYLDGIKRSQHDRANLFNRMLRMAPIRNKLLSLTHEDFETAVTSIQGMLYDLLEKEEKKRSNNDETKRRRELERKLLQEHHDGIDL